MRLVILLASLIAASSAFSTCRNVWVDDDFNSATPPVMKEVCDSTLDLPAINLPGVQPIQRPQVRPIERATVPPVGTTRCRTQSVYEHGRWVNKQICQ